MINSTAIFANCAAGTDLFFHLVEYRQPPASGSHVTIEPSTIQNVKKYSCYQQPVTTPMMQNGAQRNLFTCFARGNAPALVPSQ